MNKYTLVWYWMETFEGALIIPVGIITKKCHLNDGSKKKTVACTERTLLMNNHGDDFG